jgi:lipopolysaccharide export system protein LptA
MLSRRPLALFLALASAATIAAPAAVWAQTARPAAAAGGERKASSAQSQASLGDAFKGFGSNSKDPVQIEADSLEVRDRDNMAIFTGNVVVRQKDTVMRTKLLRVFYEPKQQGQAAAAPTQSQQIRRYEAEGKVLISQGDQTVSGETGWFDMPSSKAQINTNVVLTQGKNVGTGGRIDVNLTTGQYVLSGNRPTLVFEPTDEAGKN